AELFRETVYDPLTPGWPGMPVTVEEARNAPGGAAGKGIDEVVEHYVQVIAGLDRRPVVVGHSFGGLIAQRLLGQDLASAAPLSEKPPAPAGGGCPVEQAQAWFGCGCPAGSPATRRGSLEGPRPNGREIRECRARSPIRGGV